MVSLRTEDEKAGSHIKGRTEDNLAAKGHISGISLSSVLQLIELEKKSCKVIVKSQAKRGILCFKNGELYDAETDCLQGEKAAYEIMSWNEDEIEIDVCDKKRKKSIGPTLRHILIDSFRIKDEEKALNKERGEDNSAVKEEEGAKVLRFSQDNVNLNKKEVDIMAAEEILKEFSSVDGFAGVAVFTPQGESLAVLEAAGAKTNLREIGVLANNILVNAQKASLEMGFGRGQFIHVESEHAHIIVRCLNEGTDPLKSQPGKAHIHLVLVLASDESIGMAKLKVNSLVSQLAPNFRI